MAQSHLHQELATLAFAHVQDGAGDLYAKAADLVRDADKIAANPKLKQVDCMGFGGEYHISKPYAFGSMFDVACGTKVDLMQRVIPAHQVPTCESCIKAVFEK